MKSLTLSVNASLKKLRTDYIDLLYVHWWDFTTSVEEVMHGLNALISTGKVLYLGVSDTPAWVVVKANAYARQHGLRPFSVYQGRWSANFRDMEREIVPMCEDQGMAIAPWGPLGQGRLKPAKTRAEQHVGAPRAAQMSETEVKISDALEKVAKRKETSLYAIVSAIISAFRLTSAYRILHLAGSILHHAESPQRLSHRRSTQGRTSQRQHRSPQNLLVEGRYLRD